MQKGKLLINLRHHRVRSALTTALKDLKWQVYEEIHCISSSGSTRLVDIFAIHQQSKRALVLDPTIRFERDVTQAEDVDREKKEI